ncbi:MAG: sulfite exporter TauE/SafE family protein [Gammaproteobacteria bacterium]|nr:sulfite exporter TauE/SafE family protein [Gammaproteobacteria bacterium]
MTIITNIEVVAVVCVAFVLGGLVKGLVGFGLPLVTVPLLSSVASIPEAVALNFLPVVFSNIIQIAETRSSRAVVARVWPLLATTAVLLYFGSIFLTVLDKQLLQAAIGVLIIGHIAFDHRDVAMDLTRKMERLALFGTGVLAAILGSVSSFAMFPSVQVLHSMRLTRNEFVLSVCLFLLLAYVALWLGLLRQGIPVAGLLLDSLFCTLPLAAGTMFGGLVRNRVSQSTFRLWVKIGLVATGAILISRQLIAWMTG